MANNIFNLPPNGADVPQDPSIAKAFAAPAPTAQAQAPQAPTGPVNVVSPTGELHSIPGEQLQDAIAQGYKPAEPHQVEAHFRKEKYGTLGQKVITALEGAASALTFGASTGIEQGLGLAEAEDIRGRAEENPIVHVGGEGLGLAGSALFPEIGGAATALEASGAAAARALVPGARGMLEAREALSVAQKAANDGSKVLGAAFEAGQDVKEAQKAYDAARAATPLISRIGSSAVKAAADNALFQTGHEVSKLISSDPTQDPSHAVQTAIADIGLAGLLGGGLGVGTGAAGELWKATAGPKVSSFLNAIRERTGGLEGEATTPVDALLNKAGIEASPEVKAALGDSEMAQKMGKTLEQSDTTAGGRKFQRLRNDTVKDLGDATVRSFGVEPEAVLGRAEVSPYEAGNKIGKTLADEYEAQMAPLSKEFDALKEKYSDKPLVKDVTTPNPELDMSSPYTPKRMPDIHTPGTASTIANKIAQLAETNDWTNGPLEIRNELARVFKALPKQETLSDLNKLASQIGENTASTLPFGQQTPLSRAGAIMKKAIIEEQENLALQVLGKDSPELVERYQQARQAYRQQSLLKEALDDRLKIRGSTSGYAKGLRTMAQTDAEKLLSRLSGKGDADLLQFLSKNFPETAQAVKEHHVNELFQKAMAKANPATGESFNAQTLVTALNKMPKELREFVAPGDTLEKTGAIADLLDRFKRQPHNFSNTARTVDKLMDGFPGSAMAMVSMLTGHGLGAAALVGTATKLLAKDAPDAVRMGLLKYMGSSNPVEAGAFKAAVDFIHSVAKGEQITARASKAVFKAGQEVLPQSAMPSAKDREKLDKQLKGLQTTPGGQLNRLQDVGGKTSYYLPEHGAALAQTASNAAIYLNSLRPNEDKRSPLDTKPVPNAAQKARFESALNIAQQPLIVLDKIKKGTLTANDAQDLRALYPALYNRMAQKLTNEVNEQMTKGATIPYKTRLGLSLFVGQPLDSSMTPQSIMSAQPKPTEQPQGQVKGPGEVKHTGTSLNKLPGMYQTAEQKAQVGKQG